MVKGVCAEREGDYLINKCSTDAKYFYADVDRLRYAEAPLKAAFALVGFSGGNTESWHSWYKTNLRLASHIAGMPPSCPLKPGLVTELLKASTLVYRQAQEAFQDTLHTPVDAAKRPRCFLPPGEARNAVHTLNERVERIRQEIKDGLHGVAVDASFNTWSGGGKRPSGTPERDTEEWPETRAKQQKTQWGSAASLGVYASADFKSIYFGDKTMIAFDAPVDLDAVCAADVAPGALPGRHKWCTNPQRCWAKWGWDAHARPESHPDAACKGTATPGDTDWAGVITLHDKEAGIP